MQRTLEHEQEEDAAHAIHGTRDIYYRKSKELGFRARSAWKLLQVADQCDIFNEVKYAVDLCAAPGSWSQVLVKQLNKQNGSSVSPPSPSDVRVISVDLQEMSPIPGVHCIRGDITSRETSEAIINYFQHQCQLVVSDGAPDVTGLHAIDEYVQAQLMIAALNICIHILCEGGCFVAKIFREEAYQLLACQFRCFFESVECLKPSSSRIRSAEHFIVCKNFRRPKFYQTHHVQTMTSDLSHLIFPTSVHQLVTSSVTNFVQCGDLQTTPTDSTTAQITDTPNISLYDKQQLRRFLTGVPMHDLYANLNNKAIQ